LEKYHTVTSTSFISFGLDARDNVVSDKINNSNNNFTVHNHTFYIF